MKTLQLLLIALFLGSLTMQCSKNLEGSTISGEIVGSENLQVFLDKIIYGKANAVISRNDIGSNGKFAFNFPEGLEPGVYNVRIGAKRVSVILDEPNQKVHLKGQLSTMQNYDLEIEGSQSSAILSETMGKLISREVGLQDIQTIVDSAASPILASFIAFRSLGTEGSYLPIHQVALEKLNTQMPGSELTSAYTAYVAQVEAAYQQQRMMEAIQVGNPAPDIKLPAPDGKEYSLSDLKGKVVLLDFWASWCGPCRRENPNVVKVYNKYKDRGFTIFSVSLDGIDGRTASRLDAEQITQYNAGQRKRWVDAIAKDNLTWPYHVSDLKKWDCAPAQVYGVRSIPRAFMINREGIIVSTSVRGARDIEQQLLKHI